MGYYDREESVQNGCIKHGRQDQCQQNVSVTYGRSHTDTQPRHRAVHLLHKSVLSRLVDLDDTNTYNKRYLTLDESSLGRPSCNLCLYSASFERIFVSFVFINLVRVSNLCFGSVSLNVTHVLVP